MNLLIKDNKNKQHTLDIETMDFNKLSKQLSYIFTDFKIISNSKSLSVVYNNDIRNYNVIKATLLEKDELINYHIEFCMDIIRNLKINISLQNSEKILSTISIIG